MSKPIRWGSTERALAAVLLLGVLIRLPFLITGFHQARDFETYIRWGRFAELHGLSEVYTGSDVSYPPLLLYFFHGAAWTQDQVAPVGPGQASGNRLAVALLQAGSILADL